MKLYEQIIASTKSSHGGSTLITHDRSIHVSELCRLAEEFAERLRSTGVRAKSGVLLQVESPLEFIVSLLALLQLNAVAIPVVTNESYPANYWVKHAQPHWIIQESRSGENQFGAELSLVLRPHMENDGLPYVPHIPDAAFVRMTSGTTGIPKGVVLTEKSASERILCALRALELESTDTVLWLLQMPYHFIVSILLYLVRGVNICVPRELSPTEIDRALTQHRCSVSYASPLEYHLMLDGSGSAPINCLHRAYCTSGKLNSKLAQDFFAKYCLPLTQIYGVIEVGLPLSNHHRAKEAPTLAGCATPGFEVGVFSDQLQKLSPGQVGELAFKGPGLFDGYLNPAVLSQELLRQGWYMSGDYATQNERGEIYVLGRRSSAFTFQGQLVIPEEVEGIFDAVPGVRSSRLLAPASQSQQRLVLQYQASSNSGISSDNLKELAKARNSPLLGLIDFHAVTSVARTPNGKLKR